MTYIAFYAYNIGTHVAGIIAANTTGITDQGFVSALPFIGIAPQVLLVHVNLSILITSLQYR